MFELIYRSKAVPNLSSSDILDILKESREYNLAVDITGCLLYYNYEFIQILEGDRKSVMELFSKIENDKRHFNLDLIIQNEKHHRTFKHWSMAYHELKKSEVNDLSKDHFINSFLTISHLAEKPTDVIKLFWKLSNELLKS
ncbi:MAG: hypothetical protein K0R26_2921 [Bacteroidota bacterium]|jgi:hypothetical protein|nr:hypothetical protein [Bacteroidota bacterium]